MQQTQDGSVLVCQPGHELNAVCSYAPAPGDARADNILSSHRATRAHRFSEVCEPLRNSQTAMSAAASGNSTEKEYFTEQPSSTAELGDYVLAQLRSRKGGDRGGLGERKNQREG